MLEAFGTRATHLARGGVNLLVAVVARSVDRPQRARPRAPLEPPERLTLTPLALHAQRDPSPGVVPAVRVGAVVGFAFFLMELVWYRMLVAAARRIGLHVRPRARRSRWPASASADCSTRSSPSDGRRHCRGFAATCLLEARGGRARRSRSAIASRCWRWCCSRSSVAGFGATSRAGRSSRRIVVLPPAIVAGYQFPLLIALFGQGRERVGRTGRARLRGQHRRRHRRFAGRRLRPAAVAVRAGRVAAVALVLVLLGSAQLARRHSEAAEAHARARLACSRPLVLLGSRRSCCVSGDRSDRGLAAQRHRRRPRAARDVFTSPNQLRGWTNSPSAARIVWDGDGVESSVALTLESDRLRLHRQRQGRRQRARRRRHAGDARPARRARCTRPPTRALVIGLGTGSTAGWLGAVPVDGARRRRRARAAASSTWRAPARRSTTTCCSNPKVHITIGDARETLLTTRDRYDIIASEPSNPFRAGIASLFTRRVLPGRAQTA